MKAALRLRQSRDFARVRRQGKVYRHPVMLLSVCANSLPGNRYGFIVGKAVGAAVARNRCKRRLRALMDAIHGCLQQGYDIVIIARPALLQQPFRELQRIVNVLFRRARLLKAG